MAVFFLVMKGIRRHYDEVAEEVRRAGRPVPLRTRVHAIVAVSKLHKPTMRALAYAKASRPNTARGGLRGHRAGGGTARLL